jgi:hypothetical protein
VFLVIRIEKLEHCSLERGSLSLQFMSFVLLACICIIHSAGRSGVWVVESIYEISQRALYAAYSGLFGTTPDKI